MSLHSSVFLAISLLAAGPSAAGPADDALAALEPPHPDLPALQAVAQMDCAELNVELVKQVGLNNYAKPDDGNALLVMTAQALKRCRDIDSTTVTTAREGVASTISYLDELDRRPEVCAIADVIERAPQAGDSERKFRDFRMTYCRDPATTQWTQADTRAVADRTERAIRTSTAVAKMRVALRSQRLFSPAGDNAIEYALEGRSVSSDAKGGAEFESALMDLLPYAIIAAEQAFQRHDQVELARLVGLIARADPEAPALSRLKELMRSK
jgi:hypothetical protein